MRKRRIWVTLAAGGGATGAVLWFLLSRPSGDEVLFGRIQIDMMEEEVTDLLEVNGWNRGFTVGTLSRFDTRYYRPAGLFTDGPEIIVSFAYSPPADRIQ